MSASPHALHFPNAVPSIVGNGRSVVSVNPGAFRFARGGNAAGRFFLKMEGRSLPLADAVAESICFPGGVEFTCRFGDITLRALHGAFPDTDYFAHFELRGANADAMLCVEPEASLNVLRHGNSSCTFTLGKPLISPDINELRAALERPYLNGFTLHSPSPRLNRAVAFSQQLLDLSFDGNLMVCEIFRWQDVWARDLASGLLPGALVSGRAPLALRSLDYDLARYSATDPDGCKNQDDTSKGGTIDGVAWTLHSLWLAYLCDGDRSRLEKGSEIMRPWVRFWLTRDTNDDGLVSDVADHFDHMYTVLAPDGARTLGTSALYALLLRRAGDIAHALDLDEEARDFTARHARTSASVNEHFWNEDLGCYANLLLWGATDLRVNQTYHAMLLLAGAIPAERARRCFDAVARDNHFHFGSATLTPRVCHVGPENDQNVKIWPWWNLWEADARFLFGDTEGALRLIDQAAATLELPDHPGFVKEVLTTEGDLDGGKAFVTAAGNLLATLATGLLGIRHIAPGQLRVAPAFPKQWIQCRASLPTAGGRVTLSFQAGRLHIVVEDPSILSVQADATAEVLGAEHRPLSDLWVEPRMEPVRAALPSPLLSRRAVSFRDPGIPHTNFADFPAPTVDAKELESTLANEEIQALVVAGSSLPLHTPQGASVPHLLERFLARGGALVLFGTTTSPRSTIPGKGAMGEQGGLIEWYDFLPLRTTTPLKDWRFAPSPFSVSDPNRAADDSAIARGWAREDGGDAPWRTLSPHNRMSDKSPSGPWGWYRASFELPAAWKGRDLWMEWGPVEDFDFVYVNGISAGDYRSQRTRHNHTLPVRTKDFWDLNRTTPRRYKLSPGTPAYAALRFGAHNTLTLQAYACWEGRGLDESYPATAGVETESFAWQPTDPDRPGQAFARTWRKGAAYWGAEKFFNTWETRCGAFGFAVQGSGFAPDTNGPLAGFDAWNSPVDEAFTDYAVFKPWRFQPLAYTHTQRHLLHPDHGERYPCAARLIRDGGGEIILIGASAAAHPRGVDLLSALGLHSSPKTATLSGSGASPNWCNP